MTKIINLLSLIFLFSIQIKAQNKLILDENTTPEYTELIEAYEQLDRKFDHAKLLNYGTTDFGLPLKLFVISKLGEFDAVSAKEKGKAILLINNGIHPGEPCGVNASLMLAQDILSQKNELYKELDDLIICIVPLYNIGGAHNRSSNTRVNQDGPKMYGFRGNARNFDLNRDFIKSDTKNAHAFIQIFQTWKPDFFIDTHTSNGADYQYVMTLIATQNNKLNPVLAPYMKSVILPFFYESIKKKGYPMTPYVSSYKSSPDAGIKDFMDFPRFSSGYTSLFNTFSFITEAHMFKPFPERVKATYAFIESTIEFMAENKNTILKKRQEANEYSLAQEAFPLQWELDTTKFESIDFMGYEVAYKTSKITSLQRMYYDRTKAYTRKIPYYNQFKPTFSVLKPKYYVIPQAYSTIVEKLRANNVLVEIQENEQNVKAEIYVIENYKTRNAYEGHYLHYNVEVSKIDKEMTIRKGDFIVDMNQLNNRFAVEVLEPQAADSYFAWNFFDSNLQQKEWFSPYVFEDLATEILKENPELKKEFFAKKKNEPDFNQSQWTQLYFIYRRSEYFEKNFKHYPVFRVNE